MIYIFKIYSPIECTSNYGRLQQRISTNSLEIVVVFDTLEHA